MNISVGKMHRKKRNLWYLTKLGKIWAGFQFITSIKTIAYMSHLLLLGKFEYSGGPIFKVVLEC